MMHARKPSGILMCDAALEPFAKYIDIHVLLTWHVANTEQLTPVIATMQHLLLEKSPSYPTPSSGAWTYHWAIPFNKGVPRG